MICAVFGALIVAGIYAARDHTTLFRSAGASGEGGVSGASGGPADAKASRPTGFADLDASDPVVRFSETRVGHVLIPSTQSDQCQRLLFDNRTGAYYDASEVFCGQRLEQAPAVAVMPVRLEALMKSFKR